MVNLKSLLLESGDIKSFDRVKIIAPNLETLRLISFENLTNFDSIERFQHLKHLIIIDCNYSDNLLDRCSFPELEGFLYKLYKIPSLEKINKLISSFPLNLKVLSIKSDTNIKLEPGTLLFPGELLHLKFLNLSFAGYFVKYDKRLNYLSIRIPNIVFEPSFQVSQSIRMINIKANYLTFESPYFLHCLPDTLELLSFLARKQRKMGPLTQKVKWP